MTDNTNSLLSNMNTAEYGAAAPEDLVIVGLDVEAKPGQFVDPRLRLPVDEALAKDLDLNGQDTDLKVFIDSKTKKVFIDAGRRRCRAARLVNQWRLAGVAPSGKTDPMVLRYQIVSKGTSMKERVAAMFAENELRLDDNAAVKAEKMAWFLKEYGSTEENIEYLCTRMGLNRRRFDELLTLRENAPEAIFEAAKKGPDAPGGLGVEAAIATQDLPEERQQEIAEELKQEAEEAKAAEAEGKPVEKVSKKKQASRSANALREEAKVAKAAKKGETKFPRPTTSEKKNWLEDVKFQNKQIKKAGGEAIKVDAEKFFGWLNGTNKNPLEAEYKARGLVFAEE